MRQGVNALLVLSVPVVPLWVGSSTTTLTLLFTSTRLSGTRCCCGCLDILLRACCRSTAVKTIQRNRSACLLSPSGATVARSGS